MARDPTSKRRQTARDAKPIGRRARVVLAIARPAINQISFVDVPISEPSASESDRLRHLYELGSRYHRAHLELAAAYQRAFKAIYELADGSRPAKRAALREVLHASDDIEASAHSMTTLAGLKQVVRVATAAVHALDAITLATTSGQLDDALAVLSHLLPQRTGVLTNAPPPSERDRLLAYVMRASVPVGDGSNGYEQIQQLVCPPWTEIAWFAWCAAGSETKWNNAWVTWPPVERFSFETIGRAAGMTAGAVRESRRRQRIS